MNIQDFPTYHYTELADIKVGDKTPESMTEPYDSALVKVPRFKNRLINDNQVFVISTQKTKPKYRFKEGQELKVCAPFLFESTAVCIGSTEFMHKGFRMQGWMFQFK